MKRNALFLIVLAILPMLSFADSGERGLYRVFEKAVYYDGYNIDNIFDANLDDGIIRHANHLYSKKLDLAQLPEGLSNLQLEVEIGALCDNYDRMGRVILAFVPKNADSYDPELTERIELARFITPFMNKNKRPFTVPYVYEIDDFRHILFDKDLRAKYDFWLETELFGIPYAAQKQVKGCYERNDVFEATVDFTFDAAPDGPAQPEAQALAYENANSAPDSRTILKPIYISKSELKGNVNFNNYKEVACDTLGVTTRTFKFNLEADVEDSEIVMILTNHGANEDGEEYYRRHHLGYVDKELNLVYTPGGVSCEPYRKYNTQKNGIYQDARPESFWQEYINWCPGQAVPIRRMHLGALNKGEHQIMIRVPDAVFVGHDGDFRPSLYFLGISDGHIIPGAVNGIHDDAGDIKLRRDGDIILIDSPARLREVRLYSFDGRLLEGRYNPGETFSLEPFPAGQYIVVATDEDFHLAYLKVVK